MNIKHIVLGAALIAAGAPTAGAWVVRDQVTDVFVSSGTDLVVARRIRHNLKLDVKEAVWELFSKEAPAQALLGLGFSGGKYAHNWKWPDGVNAYPRKELLHQVLHGAAGSSEKDPPVTEAAFRAFLIRKLKLQALTPTDVCGATLAEEKSGYRISVNGFSRKLPWVHHNNAGKPFVRTVNRCFETGPKVLGVVIVTKGTAMAAAEPGVKQEVYPDYVNENLIWTFEPLKM